MTKADLTESVAKSSQVPAKTVTYFTPGRGLKEIINS